jgi:transcriptional regulator with XRE-family HTH domain
MFKEIFTKLCNERGEAPSAVCEHVGLSNSAYSKWDETSVPRTATLYRIAEYFNVSVAYLKGEEPDSDPIQLDDSRVGIMKKLNTLTPDQVKAAEQYIDFLASQTQNQ